MPRLKKNRKGRPTLLSRLSVAQLTSELEQRRSMLDGLRAQRESLANDLTSLDAQIAEIEPLGSAVAPVPQRGPGRPKGARRGRGGNKQPLQVLLHSLLKGKTMSVADMTAAAKKIGYKSKSKNFRKVVSLGLLKHRKMFKRVGRGQYTAK